MRLHNILSGSELISRNFDNEYPAEIEEPDSTETRSGKGSEGVAVLPAPPKCGGSETPDPDLWFRDSFHRPAQRSGALTVR